MAEATKKDEKQSIDSKKVEESDGASIDLSAGHSKPHLDEKGGYTQVNRAGADEPRLDNVKAHGPAADARKAGPVPIVDRDQILNMSDEDVKNLEERKANLDKAHYALSAELEKQRVPIGSIVGGTYNVISCPNCGARLTTTDGNVRQV